MKTAFEFKKRDDLSIPDKSVYDGAVKQLGFFPNMYAVIANSKTALSRYVKAEFTQSSLTTNENEIISLIVSQINNCHYCLSFHTSYLLKLGFSDIQIIEIRKGSASFDAKLNALIKLTKNIVEMRGHIDTQLVDDLIAAGYTVETVIDTIMMINLRGVTNYVYAALGGFEIDFPLATVI